MNLREDTAGWDCCIFYTYLIFIKNSIKEPGSLRQSKIASGYPGTLLLRNKNPTAV
jgi:hypothetical protein